MKLCLLVRLELELQKLAPEVQKWNRYNEEQKHHLILLLQICSDHVDLKEHKLSILHKKVSNIIHQFLFMQARQHCNMMVTTTFKITVHAQLEVDKLK